MKRFYITFGSGHLGGFGAYYYLVIDAPDEMVARRAAGIMFDRKWAGIYVVPPRHGEAPIGYAIAHLGAVDDVIVNTRRHIPEKVAEMSNEQETS